MDLQFDADPSIRTIQCADCGEAHEGATGLLRKHGGAYAIYFSSSYPHADEAYLDVVLGEFGKGADYEGNVTFGCRIGRVERQAEPAASLVDGGAALSTNPLFGRKLDRQAALGHPRVDELWEVVDWLVVNDPVLHKHVFHME